MNARVAPHARVTICEPREGWSRPYYERQLAQYVRDRGAAPRTVTLHPETMSALGFATSWIDATADALSPDSLLVSSPEYPRDAITLYE